MTAMSSKLVILAAGGTGGHVFPAEALAAELLSRGYRLALITDDRGQEYGGALGALETHRILAGGVAGKSPVNLAKSAVKLGLGALQARRLLKRLNPSAVIGFGGYASVPTMVAASFLGLTTAIHEQNAVLGRANRLLAARVTRIATSFSHTRMIPEGSEQKVRLTGMPVRAAFAANRDIPYPSVSAAGPFRILITGGSQGARILSDVVPVALAELDEPLKKRLRVTQQCREEDLERVREVYAGAGIEADLRGFFNNIPERLAQAHLLVARSGASTIAEMTAIGRPGVLVPYRFATDDHQSHNAHAAAEVGAAWLIAEDALTPARLAERLSSLDALPVMLERAATASKDMGRATAAGDLADLVEGLLANGNGGGESRHDEGAGRAAA